MRDSRQDRKFLRKHHTHGQKKKSNYFWKVYDFVESTPLLSDRNLLQNPGSCILAENLSEADKNAETRNSTESLDTQFDIALILQMQIIDSSSVRDHVLNMQK